MPIAEHIEVFMEARSMFAYLDSGSGSILLQMLLGGIAGLGVFLRMNWQRVKAGFSRSGRRSSADPSGTVDSTS